MKLVPLRVQDWFVSHPSIDWILPAVAFSIWHLTFHGRGLQTGESQVATFTSVSTLAGLVLAGATFVCTMIYQSSAHGVVKLRDYYKVELLKNWASIFPFLLISAIFPTASLIVQSNSAGFAFALSLFAASMTTIKAARIFTWLQLMLKLHDGRHSVIRDAEPARLVDPAELESDS